MREMQFQRFVPISRILRRRAVMVSGSARLILFPAREQILRSRRRFEPATSAPFLNPLNNHLAAEPRERARKQEARETVRQYDDEDGCPSGGGLPLARLTNLQWLRGKNPTTALEKKGMWRESEMEQEGGSEAKSGCWLRKNKTNRLLTPLPLPPFLGAWNSGYGNSLNWSAERGDVQKLAVTTLPNASFIAAS